MRYVNDELWNILIESGTVKTYPQGSIIYLQDTVCDGLHCIVKGRVKNCLLLPDGSETILTLLQKNKIIGEAATVHNWPHISTAIAQTDVETVLISPDTLRSLIRQNPALALVLIESMGVKLRACAAQASELSGRHVRNCLAKLLITLESYGIEKENGKWFHITHGELSGLAGTTRPNVTAILNQFARAGLIELKRGKLRIINAIELDNIAHGE